MSPFHLPAPGTLVQLAVRGGFVYVSVRSPVARCKSCGARVIWADTPRNARVPLDAVPGPDGVYVSHFATCPQATAWSRAGRRSIE